MHFRWPSKLHRTGFQVHTMYMIFPVFSLKTYLKIVLYFFYIEMYSQITQTIYVILTILFNKLYFSKDETYDGKWVKMR
jgi:predicted benzoate:H+ symporter BenE